MRVVLDTSALLCILLREPEADDYLRLLASDAQCLIATPTWCEAAMVVTARLGLPGYELFVALLDKAKVEETAFTPMMAGIAYQAWLSYGKGRHPAGLNYGDCFAYALAKHEDAALLYKGQDFSLTDIPSAFTT